MLLRGSVTFYTSFDGWSGSCLVDSPKFGLVYSFRNVGLSMWLFPCDMDAGCTQGAEMGALKTDNTNCLNCGHISQNNAQLSHLNVLRINCMSAWQKATTHFSILALTLRVLSI